MSTFSFDISTVTGTPADARITLTELEGEDAGKIQVTVDVINGTIADLRGFFFNIENESPQFLRGLSVSGNDVTDSKFRRNRANNTGGGNNMRVLNLMKQLLQLMSSILYAKQLKIAQNLAMVS